jgi:hypothetical protein
MMWADSYGCSDVDLPGVAGTMTALSFRTGPVFVRDESGGGCTQYRFGSNR